MHFFSLDSLTIFPPWPWRHDLWLEWGIFFYSRDPSFMSLIDSPLFVKFSKMANFNFRESWFGFFFIFWDSWPELPLFLVFVYGKGVQNTWTSSFKQVACFILLCNYKGQSPFNGRLSDFSSFLTRIIQSLYYAPAGRYINLIQR
jgi:hypothetical protein